MKTQREIVVKSIRLDNGREFTSGSFKNYCKSRVIRIRYMCPYTPQQNSKSIIELGSSSSRGSYQRPYGEKQLDVQLIN